VRVVIVDDEQRDRLALRTALQVRSDIEIVGEASNGIEAIEAIHHLEPDLVFLDVEMPLVNGFDVLEHLNHRPLLIFCSKDSKHAIGAFEAGALDYLIKPLVEERVNAACEKIKEQCRKISRIPSLNHSRSGLDKIICHWRETRHVLWLHQIAAFRKEGRYTGVLTHQGSLFLSDLSLDSLEKNVKDPSFFRISRAAILSKDMIQTFQATRSGGCLVTVKDGQTYQVSRGRAGAFRAWVKI